MCRKILVISKSEEDPSSFYRLLQYLKNDENVCCADLISKRDYRSYYDKKENALKKIVLWIKISMKITAVLAWDLLHYRAGTVIINRKIFPRHCPRLSAGILKKYLDKKYVIWDFDDNIFSSGEISRAEREIYEDTADKVVVTNQYLKGLLCGKLQKKTDLLPTTDRDFEHADILQWNRIRRKLFSTNINLVWLGTKGNLVYLDGIIGQLEDAAREIKDKEVALYVISNMRYEEKTVHLKIKNVKWTRSRAFGMMPGMHIGLMPLADNAFTKGKGAFKAVQYIGAGLPVVASPVGFNCDVIWNGKNGFLTEAGWTECIKRLAQSFEEWEKYSLKARECWEKNFSSKRNLEYWKDMIQQQEIT